MLFFGFYFPQKHIKTGKKNKENTMRKSIEERMAMFLLEGKKDAYEEFFKKKMKEWGINSPDELSEKDKKKFFKEVEDEWTKEDPETDDGDE